MTHRADQIVESVASILEARVRPKGSRVYTHRRLSLSLEEGELAAHSVDFGEDQPAESKFMQMLDSVLAVQTTVMVAKATETEVRRALLEARREQHIALMADRRLGFGPQGWVVTTSYGGAEAPEFGTTGEDLVGTLTSIWLVHYRMAIDDPGNE